MTEQQSSVSSNSQVPSPAMLDTMTRVIMSQTDMTEEQVKAALEHTNYDLKRVIREYMRGGDLSSAALASTSAATSTNQMRFAEIRNFMDKSAEEYYRRQEMTKIYNQVLERKKAEAAAAAQAASAQAASASAAASKL